MIAIIKTGGKQYSVTTGQIFKVEKIEGKKGDNISLNDVLAVSNDKISTFGNPLIEGASVQVKIIDQIRDKKIIVFKKRKRQNYRLTQGHRQYLTVLQVESIIHEGKKSIGEVKEKKIKVESIKPKVEKKQNKKIPKKANTKKSIVKKTISKKTVKKKITKEKK